MRSYIRTIQCLSALCIYAEKYVTASDSNPVVRVGGIWFRTKVSRNHNTAPSVYGPIPVSLQHCAV